MGEYNEQTNNPNRQPKTDLETELNETEGSTKPTSIGELRTSESTGPGDTSWRTREDKAFKNHNVTGGESNLEDAGAGL